MRAFFRFCALSEHFPDFHPQDAAQNFFANTICTRTSSPDETLEVQFADGIAQKGRAWMRLAASRW
jgi:hypothetical protein